jgi:hypothetical protein
MSGWRKRKIKEQEMNDKDNELYRLSWTQTYDMTSITELMEELVLDNSEYKEAKEVIKHIKSKL